MRVVASHAGQQGVVRYRVDLGESGRSAGVVGVTTRAVVTLGRDDGLDLDGVGHVPGGGAVATLTSQPAVVPSQARVHDRPVAQRALLLSGELLRVGDDRIDRRRPVMTHLAEGIGNEEEARHDKRERGQGKHHSKPGDLLRQLMVPELR